MPTASYDVLGITGLSTVQRNDLMLSEGDTDLHISVIFAMIDGFDPDSGPV